VNDASLSKEKFPFYDADNPNNQVKIILCIDDREIYAYLYGLPIRRYIKLIPLEITDETVEANVTGERNDT